VTGREPGIPPGDDYVGDDYVGENFVGDDFVGENFVGENFVGENFVGDDFVGDDFVGDDYVGDDAADVDVLDGERASDDPDDEQDDVEPGLGHRGRLLLVGLAALVVGVLATLWVVQARSAAPTDFGADAGFSRDMQTHHNQAVQMAFLVRDRTDDAEVRTVAFDIITTQQQQAGQMYGWLVQWGLDQTGGHPMAWVGGEHAAAHANEDGTMPGSATANQIAELEAATGVEAERIFLRMMIAHHTGGVAMAEAAEDEARTPEVKNLATAIAVGQAAEIEQMKRMLANRS
jgi:uncharacterized protein (DUF305 family)